MRSTLAEAPPATAGRSDAWRFIVLAGVVAATCDITYALVYTGWRGVPSQRLLQSVASGLLGKGAFEGGVPTAALGLALHYGICIVAASVYWAAARRLAWLVQRPVPAGILFGLAVYGFMNDVVVPLSAVPFKMSTAPLTVATGLLVHMFGVGLPIALVTRRGQRGRGAST
jgi:hypothetical protein